MQNKIEAGVNRIMRGRIAHDIELGIRYDNEVSEGVRMTLPWAQSLTDKEGDGAIGPGALTTLLDTISGTATMAALQFCESTATMDLRVDFKCNPPPGSACIAFARPIAVLGTRGRGSVIIQSSVQAAETKETIAFSVGRFIRKPLLPDKAPPPSFTGTIH
jgi:acyl-coenzyme A thioesterase PaaI-like protein